MRYIFKFLFALLILSILILGLLGLLIWGANQGYFDKHIKSILEKHLSQHNFKSRIENVYVKHRTLSLDKIHFELPDQTKGDIHNLNLKLNFKTLLRNPLLLLKFDVGEIHYLTSSGVEVLRAKAVGNYNLKLLANEGEGELNLQAINSDDSEKTTLPATATCSYTTVAADKTLNCIVDVGDKSHLNFNAQLSYQSGKIATIKSQGKIVNIPLIIYQNLLQMLPDNEVLSFMQNYIKSGHITQGEFDVNLDKEFWEKGILASGYLNGNLHITNMEFAYGKNFPPLTKMEIETVISGSSIKFLVDKAYLGETLISQGIVTLNWRGKDTTKLVAEAISKGPLIDLLSFVPEDSLAELDKSNINLKKASGVANSQIHLEIPLNPANSNIYNITSEISNFALKIFEGDVELKSPKLNGSFNGEKVVVKGKGQVNSFASDLSYEYNLNTQQSYQHLLSIKTQVNLSGKKQKFGLMQLLKGNTILNVEYKGKENNGVISINADLKNIEFYLDKISIHKKLGVPASFLAQSTMTGNNSPRTIEFNLTGDNNLKISGNLAINKDKHKIVLSTISHKDTNLKAEVIFDKDNYTAAIQGSKLDLSEANMMQFLKKNKENVNTNLKVNIDRIKLKNGIWLDNLNLKIRCNKVRCDKGYLDSKVGTRFFKMLLKTFENNEEWVITCNNAGALLKGIGIYDKMKAGSILLILNTSRKEVKMGEIVPILKGSFSFKKFMITHTPFLTRMVSFVSLPGFISLITNNSDIAFTNMDGSFSYNNEIIKIKNGKAEGPFFDFTIYGTIDTGRHQVDLNGRVIPALYGVSSIVKNIPLINKVVSFTPYSIHQKY